MLDSSQIAQLCRKLGELPKTNGLQVTEVTTESDSKGRTNLRVTLQLNGTTYETVHPINELGDVETILKSLNCDIMFAYIQGSHPKLGIVGAAFSSGTIYMKASQYLTNILSAEILSECYDGHEFDVVRFFQLTKRLNQEPTSQEHRFFHPKSQIARDLRANPDVVPRFIAGVDFPNKIVCPCTFGTESSDINSIRLQGHELKSTENIGYDTSLPFTLEALTETMQIGTGHLVAVKPGALGDIMLDMVFDDENAANQIAETIRQALVAWESSEKQLGDDSTNANYGGHISVNKLGRGSKACELTISFRAFKDLVAYIHEYSTQRPTL